MRSILVCVISFVVIAPALARFEMKDMSFFCTAEISAGLSFDKIQKKWVSKTFNADQKFVMRMKYLQTRTVKNAIGSDESAIDFNVTITKSGRNFASPCTYSGWGDKQEPVTVNNLDVFGCISSLSRYLVNSSTNKFLETYTGEYVHRDDGGDTPYVTGGTCTRID